MDFLILNANIITVNRSNPKADAMYVKDGKIAAVGKSADLDTHVDGQVSRMDLTGKTIIPALYDTHVHLMGTGLFMQNLDVSPAGNMADLLDMVKAYADENAGSMAVRCANFDPSFLKEKRYPTMKELDDVVPDRPCFMARCDGHSCVVNSAAYKQMNIPENIQGVDIDSTTGKPTGVLRADANEHGWNYLDTLFTDDERRKGLKLAGDFAIKNGALTIHALIDTEYDIRIFNEIEPELDIKIVRYFQTTDLAAINRNKLPRVGGCICLDGSFSSHTAALNEPFADDPGNRGLLYFKDEVINDFFMEANKQGLQTSVHALAERSIQQALNGYSKALKEKPRDDHRHRIEHFELFTDDQVQQAAEMGIALGVQPAFEDRWGGPDKMYAAYLGRERAARTNNFRKLWDAGILMGGGSDSYVTEINPLLGISAAADHPFPENSLTVQEAIELFTINGARMGFEEDSKGSIEAGKQADFLVLDADPFEVKPADIRNINIEQVYSDGIAVLNK